MSLSEKYRPLNVDDCVGGVAQKVRALMDRKEISHLLLTGPPGTGKTTIAHCIANELLGDGKAANFLELNTSDERGIDVVREKILGFAKLIPVGVKRKIILLDEADSITTAAQQALRRPLEEFEETTIFIFTANQKEKIHDAIVSRCNDFEVTLSEEAIFERLSYIAECEKIDFDRDDFNIVIKYYGYDLRKMIGVLDTLIITGEIAEPDFLPAWNALDSGDWRSATKLLSPDMLVPMFEFVVRNVRDAIKVVDLTLIFAKYDWQLSAFSTNPVIQLQAFAVEVSKALGKDLNVELPEATKKPAIEKASPKKAGSKKAGFEKAGSKKSEVVAEATAPNNLGSFVE